MPAYAALIFADAYDRYYALMHAVAAASHAMPSARAAICACARGAPRDNGARRDAARRVRYACARAF